MFLRSSLYVLTLGLLASCGTTNEGGGDGQLGVTWTFLNGDCALAGVETVEISWGPVDGTAQTLDATCVAGAAELGESPSGDYAFSIVGFNSTGAAVVQSRPLRASLAGDGSTIDLTLVPKTSVVTVSWSDAEGNSCPDGVILPYYVTLYAAPTATGAPPTEEIDSTQESCSTGKTTFSDIPPGNYVVEIDSRAVTPAVTLSAEVEVQAGENAAVSLTF